MKHYPAAVIESVKELRSWGVSIGELSQKYPGIPRTTIFYWCKNVVVTSAGLARLSSNRKQHLIFARDKAVMANKIKREKFLESLKTKNITVTESLNASNTQKIALAMLCLGEASKYNSKNRSAFSLGSADPRIIRIFLELLKKCYAVDLCKIRCTVQCRADQDTRELQTFWQKFTNIPFSQFYKPQIDKRTIGKATKKPNYKGVLRVDYFDTAVQLELETISDLVYNQVSLL